MGLAGAGQRLAARRAGRKEIVALVIPVLNPSYDPPYNLALEEYVLRRLDPDEEYLILWQNRPAVIVGRFQNTAEEVNQPYVDANGIAVVRRLSGGGAVYHDLGNLNFTFIVRREPGGFNDFKRFTLPVLETLRAFGVPAERSSRNDLTIEGQKFSGNAQYVSGERLLHHGTILFDADLDAVAQVLRVQPDKIASHGVKSVRARVTNVRPYLPAEIGLNAFIQALSEQVGRHGGGLGPRYRLTEEDERGVGALKAERYGRWEWNYGDSPAFALKARRRFAQGSVEIRLDVHQGYIRDGRIYGDFLGSRDIRELEDALRGERFDIGDLRRVLSAKPVEEFFGGIGRDEILDLVFGVEPVPAD